MDPAPAPTPPLFELRPVGPVSVRPTIDPPAPAVPGYEIQGRLGQGGGGSVYKARHLGLNRTVALKVFAGGRDAPEDLARFRLEAEALARLRHPNIVQVYDVGSDGGRPFMSLEYVEGGPLDRRT